MNTTPNEPDVAESQMSWTVHGSRTVHDRSPWLRVDMVDVTAPNGERFDHAAIRIPDAAVALIVDVDAVLIAVPPALGHRPRRL